MISDFQRDFGKIFGFILIVAIVLTLPPGCGSPATPSANEDQVAQPGAFHTLEKQYENSQVDGYNMYVPHSCTPEADPFPLIVFLQGGLAVGGKVESILRWELPRELKEARTLDAELEQLKRNTFVYVMPHISAGEFYHNIEAIQQILEEVLGQYNIDEKRIYLTGLSRGGHGTWGVASKMPDRFAAIAPIAGNTRGVADFTALADLPIWTAHNVADGKVDHYRTENAVRRIEQLSKEKFHLTHTINEADYLAHDRIFTSGENSSNDHDAWTEMYNAVNFYKWLLRFRRE